MAPAEQRTIESYLLQQRDALVEQAVPLYREEVRFYRDVSDEDIVHGIHRMFDLFIMAWQQHDKRVFTTNLYEHLHHRLEEGMSLAQVLHASAITRKVLMRVLLDAVAQQCTSAVDTIQFLDDMYADVINYVSDYHSHSMQNTNRTLHVVSQCNEALIRATNEHHLLDDICAIVVNEGGYHFTWVGFMEHDDACSVRPVAYAGHESGYLSIVNFTWADTEQGNGPTGTAIRTHEPCVVHNVMTDPHFAPWREQAVQRGFHSVIGLPLVLENEILGAITIYAHEPNIFPSHEVKLLTRLAENLSYGLASLRRRLADQKLQQSEERFRYLTEYSSDAIVVVDNKGIMCYVNPAAERLFGFSSAELLGTELGIPLHTESEDISTEVSLHQRYHREFTVELRTRTIMWEGKLSYLVSLRDITTYKIVEHELEHRMKERTILLQQATQRAFEELQAREQAQYALQRNEALLQGFLDHSPAIAYAKNCDGHFILINRQMEEHFNTTRTHLLGQATNVSFPTELTTLDTDAIATIVQQCQLIEREVTWESNGSLVTFLMTFFPIFDTQDTLYAIGCIGNDITDRKRMEERLRTARNAAEAGIRAKDEFMANISHEIRTPMNAVIGMTHLLLGTQLSTEQLDFVQTIHTSGDALLTLINDILDFSQLETGMVHLEHHPFCIHDCIEESCDLLASQAANKQLELIYDIAPDTPSDVVGDIARLRQVLVNIVGNAVKFTEQGEVCVTVSGNIVSEPPKTPDTSEPTHCRLHIAVRDTGIGIDAEQQQRLFQPFSQVDGSLSRRYEGTGLGLAISKQLMTAMGGTIHVESHLGHGSTFHLWLTLPVASPITNTTARPHMSTTQPHLQHRHVLVIDANETSCTMQTALLSRWHMHPIAVATVHDAHTVLTTSEAHIDVIIANSTTPHLATCFETPLFQPTPLQPPLPVIVWCDKKEASCTVLFAVCFQLVSILPKPIRPLSLHTALQTLFVSVPHITSAQQTAQHLLTDGKESHHVLLNNKEPSHNLPPFRILLAEDNAVNQKVAIRLLERLGYHVDRAANGVEAVSAVQRQPYDIVFMDIHMPEMDGVQALHCIRRAVVPQQQPWVIAMTALASPNDETWLRAEGMDDYVSKPVKIADITAALQRAAAHYACTDTTVHADAATTQLLDISMFQTFLHEAADDECEIVAEVLDVLVENTRTLLAHMREAVATHNGHMLAHIAQTLTTNSNTIGANRLAMHGECIKTIAMTITHAAPNNGDCNELFSQATTHIAHAERTLFQLTTLFDTLHKQQIPH